MVNTHYFDPIENDVYVDHALYSSISPLLVQMWKKWTWQLFLDLTFWRIWNFVAAYTLRTSLVQWKRWHHGLNLEDSKGARVQSQLMSKLCKCCSMLREVFLSLFEQLWDCALSWSLATPNLKPIWNSGKFLREGHIP